MYISTEKEDLSFSFENGIESLKSRPGSGTYFLDGLPLVTEVPCSVPVLPIYTDVNVVPEQEQNELQANMSNLEGEIAALKVKQSSLHKKRREALNKILDIKGSTRVFCRVRPFLTTEKRRVQEPFTAISGKVVIKSSGSGKEFGCDKVFCQEATQEDVFAEVQPILRSALDGHNVCILAYGQTGTGKTFTMDGTHEKPGIISRALEQLFHEASLRSFTFSMSMLEVYMGNLRDLLAKKPLHRSYEAVSRCNLNIQTDPKGSVEIEGLTEIPISDFKKASWLYNKGKRVRSTSWTNVNEASSRSHCLTRITICQTGDACSYKKISKLWMVDLGGSERLLKTGAIGQTLDEGRAINLSLSALGDVIAALKRKRGHVPYRNSKLTQILKDSIGDESKTLMLVHISPCEEDIGETLCSLNFAKRARAIESGKELPEDLKSQREKKIAELEEEMREAEDECRKLNDQIQKAEFLLSETKKTSNTYQLLDEPSNPEVPRTPKTSEKPIKRSKNSNALPRFMASTAASRQRHNVSEKEIGRRSLKSALRSSLQISGSHSISCSDSTFKATLKNPNKKSRYGESNSTPLVENLICNGSDPKIKSMPQSKIVTSSNPNLRVLPSRHRRRMSDLI